MKNAKKLQMRGRLMGGSVLAISLAAATVISTPMPAHADWISSVLDQRCDSADINGITGNVRNAIEASVRRSESSIQAPSPVGDLSCLNDLMTLPLDTFSRLGGLLDSLSSGLQNLSNLDLNIDVDIAGHICSFAAKKWAQLTAPLSNIGGTISDFASISADAAIRAAVESAFTNDSGSHVSAVPSFTGLSNLTDSSGYSGSIDDYTTPDTTVSDATGDSEIFPTYTDPTDPDAGEVLTDDSATTASIEADYNAELAKAAADYAACRISHSYSSGYWSTHSGSCTFDAPAPPVYPSTSSSVLGESESAPVDTATPAATDQPDTGAAAADTERTYGQDRVVTPATPAEGAPEAGPVTPQAAPQTIWEMLGSGSTN